MLGHFLASYWKCRSQENKCDMMFVLWYTATSNLSSGGKKEQYEMFWVWCEVEHDSKLSNLSIIDPECEFLNK